jgi:glycosyltransferase involved in cell wall biosynthesis
VPAVVSDLGGPKELVEDGVTGYITPAQDAEAFADAIVKLMQAPELRRQMGQAARQRVVDRSWPNAFHAFWAATAD